MDVDSLFSIFLNNYLRIIYTSFPLWKIIERSESRQWITMGIRTYCDCKRQLYLLSKDSNDINLIKYYKQYCKILVGVITEAKRSNHNNQIIKTKTNSIAWVRSELYRLRYRRFSAKLVPTFADRECHMVSMTDPYGRILGF
jgi:hypothetical protein